MEKVVFKCYRLNAFGKNKGKVNRDSIFFLTVMRQADTTLPNYESVGFHLKRVKAMIDDPTVKVTIQSAKESDSERESRYKRDGLEVLKSATAEPSDAEEAGDETMVKDVTNTAFKEALHEMHNVPVPISTAVPIINAPQEASEFALANATAA